VAAHSVTAAHPTDELDGGVLTRGEVDRLKGTYAVKCECDVPRAPCRREDRIELGERGRFAPQSLDGNDRQRHRTVVANTEAQPNGGAWNERDLVAAGHRCSWCESTAGTAEPEGGRSGPLAERMTLHQGHLRAHPCDCEEHDSDR
jgi:hypothetical protein